MKDSFVKIALAIAFVLCGGYNVLVSQQSETFSDLMVANVEALANAREIDGGKKGIEIPGDSKIISREEYDTYVIVRSSIDYTCMPGGSVDCYPHTEYITVKAPK